MVPASKVTLLDGYEDDVDLDDGVDSGPYSLIFALGEAQNFLAQTEPKRRRVKEHHDGKRPNNLQLDEGGGGGGGGGGSVFRKLMQKELDDDGSKRNSLDMDESSLGILTPNQIEAAYLDEKVLSIGQKPKEEDRSTAEFSFGLLDEQLLNNLTLTVSKANEVHVEQTPSPEELPFDPTPIAEHHKEIAKSKAAVANSTFVTSITSITSLDTGYQGDGEMSRPASRGAEHPPLARRPAPRAQVRKQTDPMTDSDFYTESEADLVEENPPRGDRRVQVIDGTLYGVDPQAAADIYANNRENMDSSGIFTDLEGNAKTEEESSSAAGPAASVQPPPPPSPSEASTKTVSENSQRKPPPPPSPKPKPPTKKYQPKATSAKAKTEPQKEPPPPPPKKPANRWGPVMDKISKGERTSKPDYKNVRSKVFDDLQVNKPAAAKRSAPASKPTNKKPTVQSAVSTLASRPKSPVKSQASTQSSSPAKKRRLRQTTASRQTNYDEGNVRTGTTSYNSGSRRATYKAPQLVLRAESPKNNRNNVEPQQQQQQQFFKHDHKGTNTSSLETTETGTITDLSSADIGRLETVLLENQDELRQSNVRINSLEVRLLKEIERNDAHEENIRLLEQERNVQEESRYCTEEKATETEKLNMTVNVSSQTEPTPKDPDRLHSELRRLRDSLERERREKLAERERCKRLETELRQSRNELEIRGVAHGNLERVNAELRDTVRLFEHIHKQLEANSLRDELSRARQELEAREAELEEQRERHSDEYARLKGEFERLLQAKPDFSEKESLKLIIDMKREEIDELKRSLALANEEVNKLRVFETKSNLLMTRVEQLEHQLEKKSEREQALLSDNKKLEEYLRDESNQKRRALQFNEELQWKLRQNKEVIDKILGYSEELGMNRSVLAQNYGCVSPRHSLERSYSFREKGSPPHHVAAAELEERMGPTSPKVKSVVEKSESLSYVLDLDDSPDVVASRIIRRSFRQNSTPKGQRASSGRRTTPSKNPLSQSASSSAILSTSDKSESSASNIEHLYDDVKDLEEATLPKLPTYGEGAERLPSPEGIAEEDKLELGDEDKLDLDEDDTSNTEDGA